VRSLRPGILVRPPPPVVEQALSDQLPPPRPCGHALAVCQRHQAVGHLRRQASLAVVPGHRGLFWHGRTGRNERRRLVVRLVALLRPELLVRLRLSVLLGLLW
jgi:hypothetical protein